MKAQERIAEAVEKITYDTFFQNMLKKYGVKDPSELSSGKKLDFFDEIDRNFKAKNEGTEDMTPKKDGQWMYNMNDEEKEFTGSFEAAAAAAAKYAAKTGQKIISVKTIQ